MILELPDDWKKVQLEYDDNRHLHIAWAIADFGGTDYWFKGTGATRAAAVGQLLHNVTTGTHVGKRKQITWELEPAKPLTPELEALASKIRISL